MMLVATLNFRLIEFSRKGLAVRRIVWGQKFAKIVPRDIVRAAVDACFHTIRPSDKFASRPSLIAYSQSEYRQASGNESDAGLLMGRSNLRGESRERCNTRTVSYSLFLWAASVVVIGAIFTSYHQPFEPPAQSILALARPTTGSGWLALHLLSSSCGCSKRVMQHLVTRHPLNGVIEQVVVIDGDGPQLPEVDSLVTSLEREGFVVSRIAGQDVPPASGLRGVPLLVFVSPDHKILYSGGYGSAGDQDAPIFQQVRAGKTPKPLALIGCAIGQNLRARADPFHLKY